MTRPQDPVLPSTVGIMTLLVAARWALLRSLRTLAFGMHLLGENRECGCHDMLTLFGQSGRDGRVRAWQVQRRNPKASLGLTTKITIRVAHLSCCTHARTGGAQRVLDLTLYHHSAAFNTTFILPEPIRSHRAFRWSEPMHVCLKA